MNSCIDFKAPKEVTIGGIQLPVISNDDVEEGENRMIGGSDVSRAASPSKDITMKMMRKVPSMIHLGGGEDDDIIADFPSFLNGNTTAVGPTKAMPSTLRPSRLPFRLHKRSVSELPQTTRLASAIASTSSSTSGGRQRSYSVDDDYAINTVSDTASSTILQDTNMSRQDDSFQSTHFPPANPFASRSYADLVKAAASESGTKPTYGKSGSFVHLLDLDDIDGDDLSTKNNDTYLLENDGSAIGMDILNMDLDDNRQQEKDEKKACLGDENLPELSHPLAGKSMRRCTSSNALEYAVIG